MAKRSEQFNPHEFKGSLVPDDVYQTNTVTHTLMRMPDGTGKALAMIYVQLATSFAEDVIERTSNAKTHKGYDTSGIKYQAVVDRFNDVLTPWGWQYEIEGEPVFEEIKTGSGKRMLDCTVKLKLTILGASKSHFGIHTAFNRGDALKGATTNALKKVAAMFGVGREAYLGTLDDDNIPIPEKPERASASTSAGKSTEKKKVEEKTGEVTEEELNGVCPVGRTTKGKRWSDIDNDTLKLIAGSTVNKRASEIAKVALARRAEPTKEQSK